MQRKQEQLSLVKGHSTYSVGQTAKQVFCTAPGLRFRLDLFPKQIDLGTSKDNPQAIDYSSPL
ncbi:hypothetical protein WDW89_12360 [Deltaproteobacteria bacterium TL4]